MGKSVDLVVAGVDLTDEVTGDTIADVLDDVGWSAIGALTIATVYVADSADLAASAVDVAHRIEHAIPGAQCVRVHDDLVGVSDIAVRTGVSREAVRLWSVGRRGPGGFPLPRGTIGAGEKCMSVWVWHEVVPWLTANFGLCADEYVLSTREIACINGHLQRVDHALDEAWKRLDELQLHAQVVVGRTTRTVFGANVSKSVRSTVRPHAVDAGFVSLARER